MAANSIENKVLGGLSCGLAVAAWYADYLVFGAIGALCGHFGSLVGIISEARVGTILIGWLIGIGLVVLIFAVGLVLGCVGVARIFKEGE